MIFANHDLKLIFVHVPKCGGTYMSTVLHYYHGFTKVEHDLSLFRRDDHADFCGESQESLSRSEAIVARRRTEEQDAQRVARLKEEMIRKTSGAKRQTSPDKEMRGDSVYSIRNKGAVRYLFDNPKHRQIFEATDDMWRTYRKFAFVRDPYERLVSAYMYVKTIERRDVQAHDARYTESFGLFLRSIEDVSNFAFSHAFISQYDHLLGPDGALMVDAVGDFSRLDEELCRILREGGSECPTEHLHPIHSWITAGKCIRNASPQEFAHTHEYYDQTALDFVNDRFAIDFSQFGFRRYTTVDEMRVDRRH